MSLRRSEATIRPPPASSRLDAVLRTGAAAYDDWVEDASTKLARAKEQISELTETIERLRREMVAKDLRHATTLSKAKVKAAECARKVDGLQEELQRRARRLVNYIRDKGDFDRNNKEILEAIAELQRVCKGEVYDGPAYADDFQA